MGNLETIYRAVFVESSGGGGGGGGGGEGGGGGGVMCMRLELVVRPELVVGQGLVVGCHGSEISTFGNKHICK